MNEDVEKKKIMYLKVEEVFAFVFGVELFSTTRINKDFFDFMIGERNCVSKESQTILKWVIVRFILYKFGDLFTKNTIRSTIILMEGVIFRKEIPEYIREERVRDFIKNIILNYGEDILEISPLSMKTLEFLGNEMARLKEMEKTNGINVFGENINDFFYLERRNLEMTFVEN